MSHACRESRRRVHACWTLAGGRQAGPETQNQLLTHHPQVLVHSRASACWPVVHTHTSDPTTGSPHVTSSLSPGELDMFKCPALAGHATTRIPPPRPGQPRYRRATGPSQPPHHLPRHPFLRSRKPCAVTAEDSAPPACPSMACTPLLSLTSAAPWIGASRSVPHVPHLAATSDAAACMSYNEGRQAPKKWACQASPCSVAPYTK